MLEYFWIFKSAIISSWTRSVSMCCYSVVHILCFSCTSVYVSVFYCAVASWIKLKRYRLYIATLFFSCAIFSNVNFWPNIIVVTAVISVTRPALNRHPLTGRYNDDIQCCQLSICKSTNTPSCGKFCLGIWLRLCINWIGFINIKYNVWHKCLNTRISSK